MGERHRPHTDPDVRMDIIDRTCGQPTSTADFCSHRGERLTIETTFWRKSWRSPQDQQLIGAGRLEQLT